jgi:hypothetical protein
VRTQAPTVEEGRLVERTCPDCGNVERRAFGEFVSGRGELASYAFGWTSGHEDVVGYFTVGLGVGNPGGGTFHAEVRDLADGDGAGFMLVDRPFEDVPEGGPDLTRDEALAHECIDFVWWVVDEVTERDRRARWMCHWIEGTPAFLTPPVADRLEPVRLVAHDEDGDWQLLCGTVDTEAVEPRMLYLYHLLDRDQTLLDVLDLAPGELAERHDLGAPWVRSAA